MFEFFGLTVESLPAMILPVLKMLLILVVGELVTLLIVRITKRTLSKTHLDVALVKFLGKALFIGLSLIVLLSALNSIGVSTTGILAALSAAGLAIAVALKDSLANVAGGILLLLSPRFHTGDYIAAGTDEGTVTNVDLLHTTIITVDNRQVSIPNGVLMNNYITNFSEEQRRRVDLDFPIPYDADVETAKQAIKAAILAHPQVLTEPAEPFVRVKGYEEHAVIIVTRTWVKTEAYWDVYFDLNEQVRAALVKSGIELAVRKLEVRVAEK